MKNFLYSLSVVFKSKFIFKNPNKSEIVIFDDNSIKDLSNLIKKFDNYFILQVRRVNINKFYITFPIIKNTIINYFKIKNLFSAYLVSLITKINPKVVLTNIDNSVKFSELAKFFQNKINFVAIQNATRNPEREKFLYENNITKKKAFEEACFSHYFCFGDYEADEFKKLNVKIDNFYPVGSVRLANFLDFMSKKKLNEQDYSSDVCLISEDMEGMNKFYKNKNFEKNFCQTAQFTIDFCIKHKKKMLFAVKRDKKYLPVVETGIVDFFKKEMEYYKNYLSPEAFQYMEENLMDRNEGEYSSYRAMYFSKITVGTVTTMLKEKLTLGGKILACNQSKMNWLNFPIEGICSLNNCRFDEFEKRMFEIFKISHDEYFSKISRKKTYLMNYNPKYSSLDMIKDKIQSFGYRQIRQA